MKSPSNDSPDRVLELAGPSVIIGRGRAAQVRLPGQDVSAAHARLQWTDGGLRVEDLGSVNGTRAASQSLEPGRTYSLDWGATVQIADHQLTVLDPATPETATPASPLLTGDAGTATLAAHLVRDMAGDRDSARLRVQVRAETVQAVVAMQKNGLKVHTPSAKQLVAWHQKALAIQNSTRGTALDAALVDRVLQLRDQVRASGPKK